ncbi:MAG TPA: hypothetical protein VND93_30710, partial [Myxococcales bacterium]|nr:hypothetical protein [Myxococcales bacterium]
RPIPPGPLGAAELRALAAALSADAVTSTTALVPLINDGPRLRAALLQVVALDPANARAAAGASLFLRPGDQADFAREMMEDPRPGVRAALFQAWAPPRMDVPGQAIPTLDPPALEALLRGGLLDPSREVRAAAAAYAFATGRGASVVGELMVNLEAPERELRWWTILALGGARDELSLHALEQIAAEPDVAAAGAAIRALAARPDGHPAWLRVLEGPDGELRRAALFGLAEVARGIAPEAIARLAKDPREDVQRVLARYRARTVARS